MTETDVVRALTEIFHETFDDDRIVLRSEMSAADVEGWDSMRMVLLVVAVEEKFRIKTSSREIDGLRCVGDFIRLISSKVG